MLTKDSERIREIVRFDVRHCGNTIVATQLGRLEAYCSWAISNESIEFEKYIVERLFSGRNNPANIRRTRQSSKHVRQELSAFLAEAHNEMLAKQSVRDDRAIAARMSLVDNLVKLGLTTTTTVPISAVLLGRVKTYTASAASTEKLANVLGQAIDVGIKLGDLLSMEVSSVTNRWLSDLEPRPSTVLRAALDLAAAETTFAATDLLRMTGANKSNVYRAIDQLEEIGGVVEVTGRKKDQIWLAPELVQAFDRVTRLSKQG